MVSLVLLRRRGFELIYFPTIRWKDVGVITYAKIAICKKRRVVGRCVSMARVVGGDVMAAIAVNPVSFLLLDISSGLYEYVRKPKKAISHSWDR